MSSGSGVIINKDGYIVTNNHVVEGADELEVTLYNNKHYRAEVIGTDPDTDIALVRIDRKDLPEAVAKTYEAKYPKARYKLVERVTTFDKEKVEKLAHYEVLLITPEKQIRSVEVSPEGKVLKVEKKVSEDEDED